MEEFRSVIVDTMLLYVLNSRIIREKDFMRKEDQYRLRQQPLKKFLAEYERRKKVEFTHPIFGYKVSYQRAMEVQARFLAKYLVDEVQEYTPLQLG